MALGLTVWLTVVVSDDVAPVVLALGVAGAALTAAAVVWPVLLYLALAVSGSGYGLHLAVDEPPLDVRVAGVAACLLVTGELVGFCAVRIDRAPPILVEVERAQITDLFVVESLRRKGLARALVASALEWVRARRVGRIEVRVVRGNPEGQAFWRSLGFSDLMDVLHRRL